MFNMSIQMIGQWFIGFLAQLAVLSFFCLYPFKGYFRYSDTKICQLAIMSLLISALIFIIIVGTIFFSNYLSDYYRVIATILFYLISCFLLWLYFDTVEVGAVYKLFVFLLVTSYSAAFEMIFRLYGIIYNYTVPNGFGLFSKYWLLAWIIYNCILGYPFIRILKRIVDYINAGISKKIWYSMNVIVLIILLALLIFFQLPFQAKLNNELIFSIFICALLVGVIFVYYWIFNVIYIEKNNTSKRDKLEFIIQMYKQNDLHLKELRELRHELRHHLNALNLYINNEDYSGARQYLNKLTQTNDEFPVKTFAADHLFNLLLSDYYQRFQNNDIDVDFNLNVLNQLNMDEFDLIELFTNLFENALEALSRVLNDRHYSLEVKQNNNFLTIYSQNTFDQSVINRSGNLLLTTKNDSVLEQHGHGMNVMRQIAEKYNGFFTYRSEEDNFQVMINLCLVDDKEEVVKVSSIKKFSRKRL